MPGKNGVLIVLLALAWWRHVSTEQTRNECDATVSDVSWALTTMLLDSRAAAR